MNLLIDRLKIKEVAERTGVAAATIRMWEQRYGFPNPARTPAGYRLYTTNDVEDIRAVMALRRRGLSIPVAVERARSTEGGEPQPQQHPSIYAAVAASDPSAHPRLLHRATLSTMSHAIEDEFLARGGRGAIFGAFQHERHYDEVAHRYNRIAGRSDATVVFADFPSVSSRPGGPTKVPIGPGDALGNEWAVIVDSPTYAACLLAWERPNRHANEPRQFESLFSLDPAAVRRASQVAAWLARNQDSALGDSLDMLLRAQPVAPEPPATALTALTNRMVGYLDERLASGQAESGD